MIGDANCASCIWWERQGPRIANATRDPSCPSSIGTCQRNAPAVVQASGSFPVALFPQTHESRFCGQWEGISDDDDDPDDGERIIAFPIDRIVHKAAA